MASILSQLSSLLFAAIMSCTHPPHIVQISLNHFPSPGLIYSEPRREEDMYYGSVLKVSDTDYVPVLIQESTLPGFACPCGKPLTVPAAAALPPLAPVSRPAPPVPLHLPLQERSEFERAYPGLVTETLELVQSSRFAAATSPSGLVVSADLARYREQRDDLDNVLLPRLMEIFTSHAPAAKTAHDAQFHVQTLCHAARSEFRELFQQAGIGNVFQRQFVKHFRCAVIKEQNRLLSAAVPTGEPPAPDVIAGYDPEALYHITGYVLRRASRTKSIPAEVVQALSQSAADRDLPSEWTESRDYGNFLMHPTPAFYCAVEAWEDAVNERAPLRSELTANSLALDQLLSVITPACTNLPAVVTSRHKELLIRFFLTLRAYRLVQRSDDEHRCNDSANRLTLRQQLQKK